MGADIYPTFLGAKSHFELMHIVLERHENSWCKLIVNIDGAMVKDIEMPKGCHFFHDMLAKFRVADIVNI